MSTLSLCAHPAAAQPRLGIEAETNFLAGRNPFLIPGDEAVTVAAELIVRPKAELSLGPKTTFEGDAELGVRQYHKRYGNFLTGHGIATIKHRESERLSITAAASRRRELPTEASAGTIDAAVDTLSIRESTAIRSNVIWSPDARTTLVTDLAWEKLKYPDSAALRDVTGFDMRVGPSRQTDSRTRIGLQIQYTLSRTDGLDDWLSARALRLTASRRISPRLRADLSAGAERASMLDPLGREQTGPRRFSGSANVCYEPQHLTMCGTAAVRTVLSGIEGLRREFFVTLSARKQLAEHSFLNATADYTRAPVNSLGFNADVARVSAGYERRMSTRLWFHSRADYLRRTRFTGERIDAAVLRIGVIFRGLGR